MSFISVPINNKPRKLSKKQKEQLAKEKEIVKKNKAAKSKYWKTAPVHVESERYVPDRNAHLSINSGPSIMPKRPAPIAVDEKSEEMQERERIAKVRSEEMKKMIAPLYSKGPYQYIGEDPEIIKNLGKKL